MMKVSTEVPYLVPAAGQHISTHRVMKVTQVQVRENQVSLWASSKECRGGLGMALKK